MGGYFISQKIKIFYVVIVVFDKCIFLIDELHLKMILII